MRGARRGHRGSETTRRTRRLTVIGLSAATTALLLSSCAVGPDTGPGLVPAGEGGGQAPASSSAPPQIPALETPRDDLDWRECGSTLASDYSTDKPSGVTLECASLQSPIDPDRPDDTIDIALTRARTATTPADAAPLVLTSGADMPSSRTLLLLASGPGRQLLSTHPVVAVDRRGIPQSSPLDCLVREDRTTIANNGLPAATQSARISRLVTAATSSADGCTETLTPNQLQFGVAGAASDLETLRKKWGVSRLGLIGVGEGSDVVIAYTAQYGGRTGRIILDTPTPFGANARDTGATEATGVQAALRTFAQRCAALPGCAFGANGQATMGSVLTKGRAGTLGGGLSDTEALAAITTALALAPNDPSAVTRVAAAIAAADSGNTAPLAAYSATAGSLRLTDGQIVAACNDMTGPVGQNEIAGLIDSWTKQNPLTGANSALALARCTGWAAATPVNPPSSFPVPPLVLNSTGDPVNGGAGAATLDSLFAKSGTQPTTVTWEGLGYSVVARSACAADVVADYVRAAPLTGPSERGCPA